MVPCTTPSSRIPLAHFLPHHACAFARCGFCIWVVQLVRHVSVRFPWLCLHPASRLGSQSVWRCGEVFLASMVCQRALAEPRHPALVRPAVICRHRFLLCSPALADCPTPPSVTPAPVHQSLAIQLLQGAREAHAACTCGHCWLHLLRRHLGGSFTVPAAAQPSSWP